jgi:hypothetical protein
MIGRLISIFQILGLGGPRIYEFDSAMKVKIYSND